MKSWPLRFIVSPVLIFKSNLILTLTCKISLLKDLTQVSKMAIYLNFGILIVLMYLFLKMVPITKIFLVLLQTLVKTIVFMTSLAFKVEVDLSLACLLGLTLSH